MNRRWVRLALQLATLALLLVALLMFPLSVMSPEVGRVVNDNPGMTVGIYFVLVTVLVAMIVINVRD